MLRMSTVSSDIVREIEAKQFLGVVSRVLNEEKEKKYSAEMKKRSRALECPLLVLGDSYKAGHFKMYREAKLMSAYGEFRQSMELRGIKDDRIVVYGMRHIIDQLVSRVITGDHVDWAKQFYGAHGLGGAKYEYPESMFDDIRELGHFPVKIDALPEGSVVLPHTPVFIVTAEGKYSRFCTFLETILTMIWYPSCVATLSKHTKVLIESAFNASVKEGKNHPLLNSRLHDFGFRGCTCVEQSVIGGSAHLLNFDGSDTMPACYHVQYHLNNGKHIGESIPATEHSVMTSFDEEIEAIRNLITEYSGQVVACVMDSYDYDFALENLLPAVAEDIVKNNVVFIIRPDSGEPVTQVVKALIAALKAGFDFDVETVSGKDYIKFKRIGVIQGDGIDYGVVRDILDAVLACGFSAANVAFGMGGGLLQKVNRDTMSFATKLSYVLPKTGEAREVMKAPLGVTEKYSFPGLMKVVKVPGSHHTVIPAEKTLPDEVDSMVTVYDNGKINELYLTESFDSIRKRVSDEWDKCENLCYLDGKWKSPIHESMKTKQDSIA